MNRRPPFPGYRQRGTALILVLWLIVLLTALVGGFALAARTEHLQGRVLVRGLVASGAARAGLEYAITRLAQPDARLQWRPDGRAYQWRYAGADVEVKIIDENGKLDLNQADAVLLAALLQGAGAEPEQAAHASLRGNRRHLVTGLQLFPVCDHLARLGGALRRHAHLHGVAERQLATRAGQECADHPRVDPSLRQQVADHVSFDRQRALVDFFGEIFHEQCDSRIVSADRGHRRRHRDVSRDMAFLLA